MSMNMKVKWKLFLGLGVVTLLSGCANSQFSCPGMPNGVICKTPSQVYEMTNSRDRLGEDDGGRAGCGAKCQERKRQGGGRGEASSRIGARLLQPINQPMPIREAPEVMRVWVAPYNDENDDLHWPSYVFTEITKRRWSIGEDAAGEAVILTPLQVDSQAAGGMSSEEPEAPAPRPAAPARTEG